VVVQHAAQHGQHVGLLVGECRKHHRRPADQHDPEERRQPIRGLALCYRRELLVPGFQHHAGASSPRPAHSQQRELPVRRQPGAGRPDLGRQAVVLHLGPVHAAEQLRRWPVPEQECLRHHQVDLRAGRKQPGRQRRQGKEREHAPDLAGQPDQQAELLLRHALALPVCDHQPHGLAGSRQPDQLPHPGPVLRVLHGRRVEPCPGGGPCRRQARAVRIHAKQSGRPLAAVDSCQRAGRPDPGPAIGAAASRPRLSRTSAPWAS
jgi:hypothetical protein